MSEDQRHWTDPHGGMASDGPTLDPEGARRETVGRTLRHARERAGWSLREVADALRIRYDYLEAIERSDFERLPGQTYAIGFVRSYANALELDDEEVVRRFKEEVAGGLNRAQDLSFPKPVNEGKVPGGALLLLSLLLAAGAYGGWYYLTKSDSDISDMVPPVPERLQALLGDEAPSGNAVGTGANAEEAPTVSQFATAPEPADTPAADTGDATADTATPEAEATVEAPSEAAPADAPETSRPETSSPETEGSGRETAAAETAASDPSSEATSGSGAAEAVEDEGTQVATAAPEPEAPEPEAAETPAPETQASGTAATPAAPEVPEATGSESAASAETTVEAGPGAETDGAIPEPPAAATEESVAPAVPETPDLASDDTGESQSEPAQTPPVGTASEGTASGEAPQTASLPDAQAPANGDETAASESAVATMSEAQREILDNAERVFGQSNADSRLVLRATQDSWVQVRGPDDSLLLTRVLNPGDVYRVPNRQGLVLHTGNAGGLSLYLDGRETARLGETGQVRRNISLDPESLR